VNTDDIRISAAEAKRRVDAREAIVLDVVQPATWAQMHRAIASAIRIEPADIPERSQGLPRERQIIAYCT